MLLSTAKRINLLSMMRFIAYSTPYGVSALLTARRNYIKAQPA